VTVIWSDDLACLRVAKLKGLFDLIPDIQPETENHQEEKRNSSSVKKLGLLS